MKTIAYIRVSTEGQDLANQKLAILDYAQRNRFKVDEFIEIRVSTRRRPEKRRIDETLGLLKNGDRLVVSELSRLGRSLGQIIAIVNQLVEQQACFVAIKEGIQFERKQDLKTKVMVALFGLFAEVERDLISERTKEGVAAARAQGRMPGRPKGALGTSKLDGRDEEIELLLKKGVSKAVIAKIMGVSRTAFYHFIRTRKLGPVAKTGGKRA